LRASDRRQQILEEAQRLFIERGFEQVTMGDIAARLGTSRPTIYTYFPTTTAILEALFDSGLERLWARLEPIVMATRLSTESPKEASVISAAFDILMDEPGFLAVLHSGGAPDFQRRRRHLLNERIASLVEPYLRPQHGPYDIPMVVTLLDGMAYWAVAEGVSDTALLKASLTGLLRNGLTHPVHARQ
jgi:AcrR family transcriptional regulator